MTSQQHFLLLFVLLRYRVKQQLTLVLCSVSTRTPLRRKLPTFAPAFKLKLRPQATSTSATSSLPILMLWLLPSRQR